MDTEITRHEDNRDGDRQRLLLKVSKWRREVDELVTAGDVHEEDIVSLAKGLAYGEMALPQVHVGCEHDLEAGWCQTQAMLDPEFECEIHTGPDSAD